MKNNRNKRQLSVASTRPSEKVVSTVKIVYWQDGAWWLGHLQEYPDYMTQGKSLKELKENLKDLYRDISGGHVPAIRKVDELVIS